MPEFSGAVPLIAAPLTPAALLVLPASSACGEDRLSLDGFSGLPLGLLGQPSRPCLHLGFTICLASCGFGNLLCGQLGRVPLCRRASFSDPRVPGRDDLLTSLQPLGSFGD